jgi:isopropylmalate/homocitrate/citramalate synthase
MTNKNEIWKTKNWWVSPWNFEGASLKGFKLAKQIKIHDVTLRDGEQQAGIIFSKDDKIRIAEKLAILGVNRIEPAMPVVSSDDEAAVREIVKRKLGPKIFAGCRSIVDEIKRASDCGVDGVTIGAPVSEALLKYGLCWPQERTLQNSIKATLAAKELGLYTAFFPIDASRADSKWYLDFIQKVEREGHFDSLVISDTFGVLSPQGVATFINRVKEITEKPLEIHFHNHFGLAVANTIVGVLSGADIIHTAITGIGEGSGNCCFEEVVMSLLSLYGIGADINYKEIYETSKYVGKICGTPANRPIVGEGTYDLETGEGVLFYRNIWPEHATVFFPLLPSFIGHPPPEIVLGKKSGVDSVKLWAEKLSIRLSDEEARKIVVLVKDMAVKFKRLLTENEFREIVESVLGSIQVNNI